MREQDGDGADRTCEVHHCAADPCVVHRDDDQIRYIDDTRPIDDPECCDRTMDMTAMVAGGGRDHVRHRYECPTCGEIVVVREREAQRTLTEYGRPVTDGGRDQHTDDPPHADDVPQTTTDASAWRPGGPRCQCGVALTAFTTAVQARQLVRVYGDADGVVPACPACIDARSGTPGITTPTVAIKKQLTTITARRYR